MHAVEQQIYASLAIEGLKAGHHTHASTPGLSASAIERHEEICNRWGSYEPGADFTRALVHVPLWLDEPPPASPSHHVVVLITYQGRDGSGRPGAVLRHIVRLTASQFARLDYNPFHLLRSRRLLESWQPETPFPSLDDYHDPTGVDDLRNIFRERYPLLRSMLQQVLAAGKLELPAPADSPAAEETLAQLWELIPVSVRRSLSLATFATKRLDDYRVVVLRQEDASLRTSLQQLEDTPPPSLDPVVGDYVDRLFAALEREDHAGALEVIRHAEVGSDVVSLPTAMESIASDDGEPSRDEISPAGGGGPVAPPPPEMPYQRHWSQERARDRRPLVAAAAVVLLLAAAVIWWATQRGSSRAPGGATDAGSQLAQIEASSLGEFVQQHRAALARMMAAGTRDFDLREEMAAASRTWDERAKRALQGEAEALNEADEVPARLRTAAGRVEEEARRGETLARIVRAGAVDDLRALADATTGAISLEPAGGELEGAMNEALAYAQALLASADALTQWERASVGRDASAWATAAAALTGALEVFPAPVPAPRRVESTAAVAASMVDVLAAERPSTMRAWAFAVPYQISRLQEGELEEASSRLRRSVARLDGPIPPPVRAVERFYGTLWDQVAPALSRGRAGAVGLLGMLAGLCGEDVPVCAIDHYAGHVARWKLEAWRRGPAPDSEEARRLLAEFGEPSLPAPKLADLATTLPLLDRMEKASIPASGDLVSEVERARSQVGRDFYGDLLEDWLVRNRRGAASTQEAFQEQYADVASALTALRGASADQAGDAFARLRARLAAIGDADLAKAEAAGEQARVAAVRKLRAACRGRVELPLQRIEVHLLTETDYAGNKRPLARLKLRLHRVGDDGPPLLQLDAPPLLAAPGVGFDAADIAVDRDLALAPDDELLLVATESGEGVVWFHRYVRAASGRHVAEAVAALGEIRVTTDIARQFASGEGVPPRGDGGALVARVRIVLADGWWSKIAAALPGLP